MRNRSFEMSIIVRNTRLEERWDAQRSMPWIVARRNAVFQIELVNHSEEPVDINWDVDTARYGYTGNVTARRIDPQDNVIAEQELPARGTVAWQVDRCSCSVWKLFGERR